MSGRTAKLVALAAASLAGTALMLAAGGSAMLVDLLRTFEQNRVAVAAGFAGWVLVANLLVLPAGSLSLMAGGAVLGTLLPAAIWFAGQLVTAPVLYRVAAASPERARAVIERYIGAAAARLVANAARDGFWSTVLLRLTPVLPSAPATLLAAAGGVTLRAFMLGSLAAGWVRPLYFASIGAAVGTLARLGSADAISTVGLLWPLAALCACAAAMVAGRHWLASRRRRRVPTAALDAPGG